MKLERLNKVLNFLDISLPISRHLVGDRHTEVHHRTIGLIIAVIGVTMAKAVIFITHNLGIHIIVDLIGYGLHAIGFIPFIKGIEQKHHTVETKTIHHEPENPNDP